MSHDPFTPAPGARGSRLATLALLLAFLLIGCYDQPVEPVVPAPDQTQAVQRTPANGPLLDGINYFSVPDPGWPSVKWQGDLVVYAHGYYAPSDDPWNPMKDEVDGTPIALIVNALGMAYASTGYQEQGLVVPMAVEDVVALVSEFNVRNQGPARRVYIVGPSEGGLVTTLAVEKHPEMFSGGLEMCGPVGDFRRQLNYFGDFHILFNYFFAPNGIPGSPAGIEPLASDTPVKPEDWDPAMKGQIEAWVAGNPSATRQVLNVTGASIDPLDPTSIQKTFVDIIWYNMFATNDAIHRLGGSPFSNQSPFRWYAGSANDLRLNLRIQRYQASPVALARINSGFQTSGTLRRPLVSLHTTGDPIIPYWHAVIFQMKVLSKGSATQYVHMPIFRYGHCNFKVFEVLAGFAVLVLKVSGQELVVTPGALPNPQEEQPLRDLAGKHGARPKVVERVQVH